MHDRLFLLPLLTEIQLHLICSNLKLPGLNLIAEHVNLQFITLADVKSLKKYVLRIIINL